MSSATSIKRAPDAPVAVAEPPRTAEDPGFRPWHFFVLASLIAATVAVMLLFLVLLVARVRLEARRADLEQLFLAIEE